MVKARDKGKVEKQSLGQIRKLGQGRKESKIPSAMTLKMIVGTWIIGRSKKDPDSSSMTGEEERKFNDGEQKLVDYLQRREEKRKGEFGQREDKRT